MEKEIFLKKLIVNNSVFYNVKLESIENGFISFFENDMMRIFEIEPFTKPILSYC